MRKHIGGQQEGSQVASRGVNIVGKPGSAFVHRGSVAETMMSHQ